MLAKMFGGMASMTQARNMNEYMNSLNSMVPDNGLISEGIADGGTVATTWKCNTLTNLKIRTNLRTLIMERKDTPPVRRIKTGSFRS